MAKKNNVYTGTGRRKSSVARVSLTSGTGKITINGRDVEEYFTDKLLILDLCQPLDITNTREMFDIEVTVKGGGMSRSEERRVGKECRSRWSPYH